MRVLATAKPNEAYENIKCISDVILEARLINNKVEFYETHVNDKKWVVKLKNEWVISLFDQNYPIQERAFLFKENRKFFFILHRDKKRFHQFYLNIKNNVNSK